MSLAGRAPYGRAAADTAPTPTPTYFDQPVIKASHYGWLIGTYFFVGGLAGAAQIIATLADAVGGRRERDVIRAGRYLALAGALISPILLIADLHAPRRWYNMLRIVRTTSAMSIGSWTLLAFGTTSGLTATAQLLADLGVSWGRRLATVFGVPAALSGSLLAVYTGTLLAATSVPLWACVPRLLPALFAASASTTASAALTLLTSGERASARRLERFALISAVVEFGLVQATERAWRQHGLSAPLEQEPLSSAHRFGVLGLGLVVPLAVGGFQVVTGRRPRRLRQLSAVASLLGAYTLRNLIVEAGNRSAERPRDYFRFTSGG